MENQDYFPIYFYLKEFILEFSKISQQTYFSCRLELGQCFYQ
jgi:hypothetical protein